MAISKVIDYPGLSVVDAIAAAKRIVGTFGSNQFNISSLAHSLDHKSEKSGTFLLKLGDLRRYKIIEGRGAQLSASNLAKTIATPINEEERKKATREMIFNIAIFKQLYDVLKSNKAPTLEEIQTQLLNLTQIDRADLPKTSEQIRKLYMNAVAHIEDENRAVQGASAASNVTTNTPPPTNNADLDRLDDGMTYFKDEGIEIKVKKNIESLETAIAVLNIHLAKLKKRKSDVD